ncbi:MAG: DUF2270 domain-containing protein [Verrucomicrobiae bacterium]|nr:DUF2270 domain-containing protein [Verrucomicrobiae bacterium]
METNQPNQTQEIDDKDYYTVITHFYRGELGRIMIWRQRLDITTNWAIVATTAMITFALGSENHTHLIFLFANILVYLLLTIEARRYRFYDAFRARVRMLEAHFIMPVLMRKTKLLQGDWKTVMSEDLLLPSFKMSRLTSILRRFRRNYIYIFGLIAIAWFVKIWMHKPESHTLLGFAEAMTANQPIDPALFWVMFIGMYAAILFLVIASARIESQKGEFGSKSMRRKKWLS